MERPEIAVYIVLPLEYFFIWEEDCFWDLEQ